MSLVTTLGIIIVTWMLIAHGWGRVMHPAPASVLATHRRAHKSDAARRRRPASRRRAR